MTESKLAPWKTNYNAYLKIECWSYLQWFSLFPFHYEMVFWFGHTFWSKL